MSELIEQAKLTDEEIRHVVVSPDHPWGIRLASFQYEFHAVADAATAKALFAVVDWLRQYDPDTQSWANVYLLEPMALTIVAILGKAGIERFEKEVRVES